MLTVFDQAAFWGLVGGVGYAGMRLSTALWGGREITARARKLAWAQFVLSIFLSPFAAHAATPIVMGLWPRANMTSAALMLGLLFNAVWPIVVKPAFMRMALAELFQIFADKLRTGAKP